MNGSNPHPVRRLGAIVAVSTCALAPKFQSSPSPKTGRYRNHPDNLDRNLQVPILTQSEDWALYCLAI